MKITYELDLCSFEAWSGGEKTLKRIIDNGLENDFEAMLDDCYPDGMSETALNDLLRFDFEWIYETLGLETEESIKDRIEEIECQIEDLKDDFENDVIYEEIKTEIEKQKYWNENYESDYSALINEINELKEELESL